MTMTYESRLLIDGKLVEASGGATYDNINPATEAVIGPVADANAADMESAITAARRAFDETTWSTDPAFRKACLTQLKDALAAHREDLRPQIVAEVGAPIGLTYAIQQDSCIDDMQWDIDLIDRFQWEYELGVHEFFGMSSNRLVVREPIGVVGAITPWNFPFMLNLSKLAPALAGRLHGDPQARARHAVLGDVDRQAGGGGDRHSRRSRKRRDVGRSRDRRRRPHR